MRLADSFIGKDGRVLSQHINNSKIVDVAEITSSSEIPKKLEDIRRTLAKNSSTKYLVVVFKQ